MLIVKQNELFDGIEQIYEFAISKEPSTQIKIILDKPVDQDFPRVFDAFLGIIDEILKDYNKEYEILLEDKIGLFKARQDNLAAFNE